MNWKSSSTSSSSSPPPVVWACFQPQGVSPSNRQHLAAAASFGHAVGPEGAAQLRGQKPQPELRSAAQKPGPPGEEGGQLCFAQGGEEVEGYDGLLRAAARGQQARQLHDADAGESVIGELHLAHFPGKHPAIGAVQQAGAALGPDAGQRLAGVGAL